MRGTILGQQVKVLKDDGCSTNVISREFVDKHRKFLNIQSTSFFINHSSKNSTEKANELVVNTEIQIGDHTYRSNWIVADCRYEILLGMLWHVACCPTIDYCSGMLKTGDIVLPSSRDRTSTIQIHNLGVKKFRSLLRKKKQNSEDFVVYQVRSINSLTCPSSTEK